MFTCTLIGPTHVVLMKNRAKFATSQLVHISSAYHKCEQNMLTPSMIDITQKVSKVQSTRN